MTQSDLKSNLHFGGKGTQYFIPTMICDFICGAFLPVVNQPSSKSICDSLQLANDTGEIGG